MNDLTWCCSPDCPVKCERHITNYPVKDTSELVSIADFSGVCRDTFPPRKESGGRVMSERQEKKKRYNLRLMWIADFDKWLNREPPMWRVFAWRRWKRERPVWEESE